MLVRGSLSPLYMQYVTGIKVFIRHDERSLHVSNIYRGYTQSSYSITVTDYLIKFYVVFILPTKMFLTLYVPIQHL